MLHPIPGAERGTSAANRRIRQHRDAESSQESESDTKRARHNFDRNEESRDAEQDGEKMELLDEERPRKMLGLSLQVRQGTNSGKP